MWTNGKQAWVQLSPDSGNKLFLVSRLDPTVLTSIHHSSPNKCEAQDHENGTDDDNDDDGHHHDDGVPG